MDSCYTYKLQKEVKWMDKGNTDHEGLETAVCPLPPAVDFRQECCYRCACSGCILQPLTPFLHRTGQQRTCQGKHISEKAKNYLRFISE